MAEQFDNFFTACGVAAAGAAKGFAKGAGDDIDAALHATVLGRATASLAEETRSMGVVDHDEGVIFVGQLADGFQVGDFAVHGEDAIGGDKLETLLGGVLELFFQVGHVVVSVTEAGGFAEADAVDDTGVIQFVADNGVFGAEDGFKQTGIGIEAGGVEDGVFGAEELGNFLFESLWMSWVPQMKRTEAMPKPRSSRLSLAAWMTSGSPARPR